MAYWVQVLGPCTRQSTNDLIGITNNNDNNHNPEYNSKNRKVALSLRRTEYASEERREEKRSLEELCFSSSDESENAVLKSWVEIRLKYIVLSFIGHTVITKKHWNERGEISWATVIIFHGKALVDDS